MDALCKRLSMDWAWMSVPWPGVARASWCSLSRVSIRIKSCKASWIWSTCKPMRIRGKGWKMIPWIGMAMMVSTRLWLGGVVSLRRDRRLADDLLQMVKACCQPLVAVLVLTDGWAAYPGSIRRAFREKVKEVAGRGRSRLQAW